MSANRKWLQRNVGGLVVGFAAGLVAVAWLRLQTGSGGAAAVLADYATLLYIGLTVAAAVLFVRAGVPLRNLGFGPPVLAHGSSNTVGLVSLYLAG